MPFIIEKSMPIPTATRKYPWGNMEVGDSISFANALDFKRGVSAANNFANRKGRTGTKYGYRFKQSRRQLRIWRIQ